MNKIVKCIKANRLGSLILFTTLWLILGIYLFISSYDPEIQILTNPYALRVVAIGFILQFFVHLIYFFYLFISRKEKYGMAKPIRPKHEEV